jgi:hypothetical protein
VNFLAQELQPDTNYFCCPPVKMIGRVVCHLLEKENIPILLVVPVWPSSAFWPALSLSPRFQESIVKEARFQPKFFKSNSAPSLFSRLSKVRNGCFSYAYMNAYIMMLQGTKLATQQWMAAEVS